jgi:hypothetical protein
MISILAELLLCKNDQIKIFDFAQKSEKQKLFYGGGVNICLLP